MFKNKLTLVIALVPFFITAQVSFTNSNSLLGNDLLTSGVAIGVADMNADGLDDIIRFDGAIFLEIEYQTQSGNFTRAEINPGQFLFPWAVCIADVDRNGFNDIVTGGEYNDLKLLTSRDGNAFDSTTLDGNDIFVQNVNFVDINNDGDIDLFACHDDGVSSPYNNNSQGGLNYDLSLINARSTMPSNNSGNYGSIWSDYDNDGDLDLYISKCRIDVDDPMDGRRLNLLFQNDGNGNFTDVAQAAGLLPLGQSWATSFEDIDNDGDLDAMIINHDISSVIYENNGNGTFTDITAATTISSELRSFGYGIQVIMEDFNNDTFVDLFLTAIDGNHILFINNGDKTFTEVPSPFPTGNLTIQSAAAGDLNNDGFIDILAGFAEDFNFPSDNPDILFLNDGNSNNWSEIRLQGIESNINGIGARIEIEGAWGKQIREVRAGESYGTMNSLMTHFGLGAHTEISKITVKWPSGIVDEVANPNINTSILIIEKSTLDIKEFDKNKFKIYPNPASNSINIGLNEKINLKSVTLYDVLGKQIDVTFNETDTNINIDLSKLDSGLYFVHLHANKTQFVHKIIKQ